MTEEPVDIELRLIQDVDTEGKKASEAIDDVAEHSERAKKSVAGLGTQATGVGAGLGKAAAGVTDYTKRIGGLNLSMQQVARELPNIAISPQLFIMAISNNLPILQDEINKTRLANEALKKSGQSFTPVWKTLIRSLFSWQTALIAGITIFTVYGKEIFSAIGNLLSFRDATKLSREELSKLTDEFAKNIGSGIGKLDAEFDKLRNAKKGTDEYYDAKRNIIKQYGSYLSGLDSEIIALNNVEGAYKAITDAIIEQSRAKALNTVYEEQGAKIVEATTKQYEIIRKEFIDRFGEGLGGFKFDQFRKEFESDGGLSYEMQRIISDFTKTETRITPGTYGQSVTTFDTNKVQDAVKQVEKAQTIAAGKIKEAQKLLGSIYDDNAAKIKDLIQEQEDLLAQYKLMPQATEEQISEKNALIEATENEIKRLKELGTTNKKLQKEYEKELKEKEKAGEALRKMSVELQQEVDASTIAAMREGASKKIAEAKAEYNKRRDAIAEKLREIEELEKTTGAPAVGQRLLLNGLLEASTAEYKAQVDSIKAEAQQEVDTVFADVNQRFSTQLENQLNSINAYYAEQLEILKENITNSDELRRKSYELDEKRRNELALAKKDHALDELAFEEQIALKQQEYANRNIFLESTKQKKLLEIQVQFASKRMRQLNEYTLLGGDATKEIEELISLIKELAKELEEPETNKLSEISDKLSESLSGMANFVSSFDEDLGGLIDMTSEFASGISSIASGDIIGGVSKLLDVVGKVISANREANREIRQFNYELAQQAIDYSLRIIATLREIQGETDSFFNVDYVNTLKQSMTGYNAAIEKEKELMGQLGDVTVKTGVKKRKFLGITFGTRGIYEDLLKVYPELIKADGELNRELAETLLQSGKLTDKATDLVNNIIRASDEADAAMQQFESTLTEFVGTLGSDLKQALDDAFASGTDSAEVMMNKIGEMMQNLASEALFSAVFGNLLKNLEEKMKASYGAGGDFNITDDLAWFFEQYPSLVDEYNKGLEKIQEDFKNQYGIDISSDAEKDSRSGTSKALAQASQDSIDELSGRIMAVQIFTSDLRTAAIESLSVNKEGLFYQKLIKSHLETIAENSGFLKELESISRDINDITLKGVKIK